MPQILTLDDLATYGRAPLPAGAPGTPTVPARPPGTLTLNDLASYGAPTKEQAAADPSEQGFWHSFYSQSFEPLVNMIGDTIRRQDYGKGAAEQILTGFAREAQNFAAHPDIRNLPLIGTGASATAARMAKQYDAGNYKGAIGSAAGFLTPFLLPEVAPRAFAAADSGLTAAREAIPPIATDLGAAASAAAPDAASAAAKAAAGLGLHKLGLGLAGDLMGLDVGLRSGARSLREAVSKGVDAFQASRAARMGLSDEALAAIEAKLTPQERLIRSMQQSISNADAEANARTAAEPERAPQVGTAEAPAPQVLTLEDLDKFGSTPSAAPETPARAAPLTAAEIAAAPAAEVAARAPAGNAYIDTAPDARAELPAELVQRVDQLRELTHHARLPLSETPALTPQQRLEDAITQHQAYTEMQAQDVIWGNRAAKADRFAGWLIKNGLDATPANITRATRELAERDAPSAETLNMIEDRVDWHNARTAAPVQSEGNAQPTADAAGTPGSPAERPLDEGAVRARAEVPAAPPGGQIYKRPIGDITTVEVPGDERQYAGRYEVRELADVQPSHTGDTFQRNPKFEHENDRAYDDPRNQRKIIDWSVSGPAGFKARNLLNTAPDSSIGPPVTDANGNVLGGNGRTMILQRVYKSNPQGAAAYRAELDRTAAHYGIDPETYAHMKQPVLVRRLDPAETNAPEAPQRAITAFNKVGTAALTPAEQAIADAKGVSLKTLDDISARMDRLGPDATLAQALEGKDGLEVMHNLTRDGVISPQEQARIATESKLTKTGRDRISDLMLGRFFTDARQLDALPDAMRAKMERIAAPLARMEGSPAWSLSRHIRDAVGLIEDAETRGITKLQDVAAQQGLFGGKEYSPESVELAQSIKVRDPLALVDAVRAYAERAKYSAEYQGPGMFNDIPGPLTPKAAFAESFSEEALQREAAAKAAKKAEASKKRAEAAAAEQSK